jgi:UPF0148 protein
MAELLQSGATMLSQTCPDCRIPLFKLTSGETLCPGCNRRAVFAKATEVEKVRAETESSEELEAVVIAKADKIKSLMAKTDNPDTLEKLAKTLMVLFDLLDRVRKTKQ